MRPKLKDFWVDVYYHLHIQNQACSLVTDVDHSELHVAIETGEAYLKVAKLANKGQFERYSVRNLLSLHPYLS